MGLDISLHAHIDSGALPPDDEVCLYSSGYTHNVAPMWRKAGIYKELYGHTKVEDARELGICLLEGIYDIERNPDNYKKLNPANGWGDYYSALEFLKDLYINCLKYPKAWIKVSR